MMAVQIVGQSMELRGGKLEHALCAGEVVVWRGWMDVLCRSTGKTAIIQYAITWRVVDGVILSQDELTNSGQHSVLLALLYAEFPCGPLSLNQECRLMLI